MRQCVKKKISLINSQAAGGTPAGKLGGSFILIRFQY